MSFTPPVLANCIAIYEAERKRVADKVAAEYAAREAEWRQQREKEQRAREEKYGKMADDLLNMYVSKIHPENLSDGGKVYCVKIPSPFTYPFEIDYLTIACNKKTAPWKCSFTRLDGSILTYSQGLDNGDELNVKQGWQILLTMTHP